VKEGRPLLAQGIVTLAIDARQEIVLLGSAEIDDAIESAIERGRTADCARPDILPASLSTPRSTRPSGPLNGTGLTKSRYVPGSISAKYISFALGSGTTWATLATAK
jgi:hypothetical protein